MRKYLTTGLFSAILGLAVGAPADAALVSRGFLDEALENYATTTALDLKANQSDFTELSDKIGTLPTAMEFYEYDANGTLGRTKYPTADVFGINDNIGGMLTAILRGFGDSIGHIVLSLPEISTRTVRLSDQIGTLPSGNFPLFPGHEILFPALNQPLTYPTSLAELITAIYGNSETDGPGLLGYIIAGFPFDTDGDGQFDFNVGTLPNFQSAERANNLAKANTAKIGTVPDGKNLAGMISETDAKIGVFPPDTTVAGMMGNPVLLNREQTIIPLYDLILWGSNGQLVINPISGATMPIPLLGLHDITHKIGTLPTEYATIGAALTAIKGIAEDAKAAALAAIPDPKTEGSTGKYVLTVDIVGDNATYRWEKIDREGETTTTTE